MNLHVSSSGMVVRGAWGEASAAHAHRHGGRTETVGSHRPGKAEPSPAGGKVRRSRDMLEGPVLARCPSCRSTFSTERTGPQDCPVCGKPLVVPDSAAAGSAGAQPSLQPPSGPPPSGPPAEQGTPWERRAELGAWRAYRDTVVEALFEPGRLFASARLDRGPAQLGFAVLTVSAASIAGQLVDYFFLRNWTQKVLRRLGGSGPFAPYWEKAAAAARETSPRAVALLALSTPLIVLAALYLNAAVTHLAALLLGQAKRGFAATFAACAYACAPLLLLAIPGCGWPIGVVWTVVLTGVGLQQSHRIPARSAAAAVLAPYALICCATCALGVLGGMAAFRGSP